MVCRYEFWESGASSGFRGLGVWGLPARFMVQAGSRYVNYVQSKLRTISYATQQPIN